MTYYDLIVDNARDHGQRYKTFKMEPLLTWLQEQPLSFLLWATTQPIHKLNRMMKGEKWAARQAAKKHDFTEEPPEDGPR